jgi:hypothetical protein
MDGTDFDTLAKTLATTRLTRLQTLRGLAVGAIAATIGFAAPDEADAKCKKNCGECQKKVKKHRNHGKRRCKCKAKANGTLCSIGTCQAGTCTRSVQPVICTNNSQCAPRVCISGQCQNCTNSNQCDAPNVCNTASGTCVAPAPPGFNCVTEGCVGPRAGLVCDTSTGQCVNCTSYTDCPRVPVQGETIQQACIGGICRGGEACQSNPDCFGVLECRAPNFNTSDTTFCLFKTECVQNNGCPDPGQVCVLSFCAVTCAPGGNCTNQCDTGVTCTCQAEACLPA